MSDSGDVSWICEKVQHSHNDWPSLKYRYKFSSNPLLIIYHENVKVSLFPLVFIPHCAATRVWLSSKCMAANLFGRLIRFWDYTNDDDRGSICVPLICVRSQTTDGHARGHRGIISVWGRVEISEKPREWTKIKPDRDLNPSLLKITQIMWGTKPSLFNENSQHFEHCLKQRL